MMTNPIGGVMTVGAMRRSAAWVAALAALSCSSPTGVDRGPGGAVATVSVTPSASTVMVGADLPLQVVVRDEIGAPLSSAPVVWSVRDGNIASVSPTGVVTGRALGSTQVAASAGGRSGICRSHPLPSSADRRRDRAARRSRHRACVARRI